MGDQDKMFMGLCLCSTGRNGGQFDDDFDPNTTTHLIAEAVGSLKHRAAVAHDLPVASPRWVFESFRAQKLLDVKNFGLRLLEGIGICTTGLTMEEKESVAQQATDHGAQYDGRLELGFTSVLIAHHPEGAKYEAAVANDIPVVHLAWFYACLEREMFVEEEEFALRPESEDPSLQPTYIAVNQQKDVQELIAALPDIVKKYRHAQSEDNGVEEDDDNWMDLLDGCVLYLLGFPPQMNAMLQSLIRTSMGTIYHNVVIHQVTHVVVSPLLSDKHTLEAIRKRVIAAGAGDECIDIQPEELYPVEFDVNVPEPTPATFATVKDTRKAPEVTEDTNGSSYLATPEKKTAPKERSIFSGYSFLLLCRDPDDKHLIKPMLKEIRGERGGAEAIALAAIDFPRLDPEQFSFISHAVVCTGAKMDEQEALRMQERIHQVQRQLRSKEDAEADETQERPQKRARHEKKPRQRMLQFVSDLWVNCSLAAKLKLSFASHDLFDVSSNRPRALFSSPVPLPGFNEVIASTSVYREVEQLVVIELLRLAGARVTRKLSSQNAFSMKLAKAAKWGLHVVTARWVVDSLLQGRRLDEDNPDFKVDTGSFTHTENEETGLSQSSPRSAST
eukprot:jgi/Phyca11/5704/fgenesh1_pm.PHYCAscaffold_7_\